MTLNALNRCRLVDSFVPKKSALQGAVSRIQDSTWERINLTLLTNAQESGIENGKMLRIDSTVTETHIHPPHRQQFVIGWCAGSDAIIKPGQ